MRQTVQKMLKDGPVNVGNVQLVERYANRESQRAAAYDMAANKGKIWYMPGRIRDTNLENVVLASYEGLPDKETPIARFAAVLERQNDPLSLKTEFQFFDNWGEKLYHYRTALAAMIKKGYSPRKAHEQISVANIVNSQTIDSTKTLNIMDRILGLQTRNYMLQMIVTKIPAPNLVFTVDSFTEGSVQAQVPELTEPYLVAHSESRVTKILYKNIGHIAESEEAMLMGEHNTMALRQDKTMRDLNRLINAQIASEIETNGTTLAGADWGAKTTGYSDNSPMNDLDAAGTIVEGNGFINNMAAGHNRVVSDLATNSWITGRGNVGPGYGDLTATLVTGIPGIPTVVKDQALTNTKFVIGDRDGIWLGQGPTVVAAYSDDVVGYRGWLAKQWWFPYVAQAGAFRVLTGVSA